MLREGSSLPVRVEVVINLFCYSFAYAGHAFQLPEPGPGDRPRRAEMVQQRLLAACADTLDFIERGASQGLRSLGPVRGDGKPMRFVAQALQEVEDGVALIERKRRAPRHKKVFPPRIAVRPLGYPDDGDIGNAELFEDAAADIELSLAAVDQDQIGPVAPVAFRILFDGAGEPAHENFAHHRIIVTARSPHPSFPRRRGRVRPGAGGGRGARPGRRSAADRELAVGVFDEALRARDNHRADCIRTLDVAVVVNLYAVQRSVDAKGGCYTVEQLTLGGALRGPPADRLARGCDYPVDQPLFVAALRYRKADPRPTERQCFFDQILLDQPVAEQYDG